MRFFRKVGEIWHAALHPEGHFVLRNSGVCFWVTEALNTSLIKRIHRVEHRTPIATGDSRRIRKVEHGVAGAAKRDAAETRREKSTRPHAREKRLSITSLGPFRREDDECRLPGVPGRSREPGDVRL